MRNGRSADVYASENACLRSMYSSCRCTNTYRHSIPKNRSNDWNHWIGKRRWFNNCFCMVLNNPQQKLPRNWNHGFRRCLDHRKAWKQHYNNPSTPGLVQLYFHSNIPAFSFGTSTRRDKGTFQNPNFCYSELAHLVISTRRRLSWSFRAHPLLSITRHFLPVQRASFPSTRESP